MATKHDKVVTHRDGFPVINLYNSLNMCSRDKLKTLYLHYHNAYGHKTYQAGEELQAINPNDPSMWQSWEVT